MKRYMIEVNSKSVKVLDDPVGFATHYNVGRTQVTLQYDKDMHKVYVERNPMLKTKFFADNEYDKAKEYVSELLDILTR